MRSRHLPPATALLAVLFVALLVSGCGSGGSTVGGGNHASTGGAIPAGREAAAFDPRDAPLDCILGKHIGAQKDAKQDDRLDILPATSGAYVTFAATPAAAEGIQLSNADPGAESIGPHLLTVGRLPDSELRAIESCLQAQGIRY